MRSKLRSRRVLLATPLLLLALAPLAGCEAVLDATIDGVFYSHHHEHHAPHCDVVLVPRHHHHGHHRRYGH